MARPRNVEEEWTGSKHYGLGGIETLDYLKAKLTGAQFEGFLLGNILKYPSRINSGPAARSESDIKKCKHYCELLLEFWKEN